MSTNVFTCLRAALEAEHNTRAANLRFYVTNGYMPSWAEEHRNNPDAGIERWSTPAKWTAYKTGMISRERAVQLATARALRDLCKGYGENLAKLDAIAAAPDLESVSICVEWKRSRMWGMNPTATCITNEPDIFTGHASGCGYDKRSAAIADALNASPAVLKMLYTAAEAALAAGQTFTRNNDSCVSWRYVLGYGSGYSILPYFESGVGVSAFETIFRNCGYALRCSFEHRNFDSYTVTRRAVT